MSNDNEFEVITILEMAKIVYSDGKMDIFNAIHKANEGVYIGRIINQNEFIDGGFIPKENIKKIFGGTKRKMLKRKSKYK
jgi:hypothetical protein